MQLDWHRAINDILAKKLSCPRCGSLEDEVLVAICARPRPPNWHRSAKAARIAKTATPASSSSPARNAPPPAACAAAVAAQEA